MDEYPDKLDYFPDFPQPDFEAIEDEVNNTNSITRDGEDNYVEPIVTVIDEPDDPIAYPHPYYANILQVGANSWEVIFEQAYVNEPDTGSNHMVRIGGQSFDDAGAQAVAAGDKWFRNIKTRENGEIKTTDGEGGAIDIEFVKYALGDDDPVTEEFAELLPSGGRVGDYWLKILEFLTDDDGNLFAVYFHPENDRWDYRPINNIEGGKRLVRRYDISDKEYKVASLIEENVTEEPRVDMVLTEGDVMKVKAEPHGAGGTLTWGNTCPNGDSERWSLTFENGMLKTMVSDGDTVPLGECNDPDVYEYDPTQPPPNYEEKTIMICEDGVETELTVLIKTPVAP